MREWIRRTASWAIALTLVMALVGTSPLPAHAVDEYEPVTTVIAGGEYIFYIDGIAPPSRPRGPYTILGSSEYGRVANILNSDQYKGLATRDDTSTWIAEESGDGIALRSKTATDREGNPLYINIDDIQGSAHFSASLGEKQTLELVENNGKVRIGRTVGGVFINLRYSNWAGDGWQAHADSGNSEFTVVKATNPQPAEFTPQYIPMNHIVDGGNYVLFIPGVIPSKMQPDSYTLLPESKTAGDEATRIGFAPFNGAYNQDKDATWVAEAMGSGFALRSLTKKDADGNPLYLNIGDAETSSTNKVGLSKTKQALEVRGDGKVRIGTQEHGAWRNFRFTNAALPGWTAGDSASSAEFSLMSWAESAGKLKELVANDDDPSASVYHAHYEKMNNIVDGGEYLFYMPGIKPTDMPSDSYTLYPEGKTAPNGETRIAFTAYKGQYAKDEDAMWVAEALGEGFALRALHKTDADGNPLYLNLGEPETGINLAVSMSPTKQELEIRKGAAGVRIGTYVDGIWYNVRFTNPALPGWTAGNPSSSAEFTPMVWAETREALADLKARDVDPVDPSQPTQRETPKLTFAAISDMHVDYGIEKQDDPMRPANREVLRRIKEEENPDLLITGGDFLSVNGDKQPWPKSRWDKWNQTINATLREVAKDGQVVAVKGNHEYEAGDGTYNASDWAEQVMNDSLGRPLSEVREDADGFSNQLGFHYKIDGMHVIGLHAPYPGPPEYSEEGIAWVRSELNEIDRNETIIFVAHYPLLDSRGMQVGYGAKSGGDELRETLARYPNLIHLYGHDHGGDHAYIRKDTFERVTPYNIDGSVVHDRTVRSTGYVSTFMGSLSYYRNTHNPANLLSAEQPKLIQALMVYVYDDRVELEMKNYGEQSGDYKYPAIYVIPKVQVADAPLTSSTWNVDKAAGVVRGIPHRTTVKDFVAGFDGAASVQVTDFDGSPISDGSRFIRPGMQVRRVQGGQITDQRPVRVDQAADLGYKFSLGPVKLDTSKDDPMAVQSIDVRELADAPEAAQLMAAMYDENGKQLQLITQPLRGSGSYPLGFRDEVKAKAATWKVWAVDSVTSLRPIAEFVSDTGERYPNPLVTNPGQRELIGVTDQRARQYRIYPADVDTFDNAYALWSFAPTEEGGWFTKSANSAPSEIKVRYSEYYGDYVVLTTASGGFFSVIDLNTKEPLYYWSEASREKNPHSIEVLPDGNVVVASSSGNTLSIYPASTGNLAKAPFQLSVHDAHSAWWDPQQQLIYTHGDELVGVKVTGTASDPKLEQEFSIELPNKGGHDLAPVLGSPSKYWVTNIEHLYWFDADDRTLTREYPGQDTLERMNIKAVTNFPESKRVVTTSPNGADQIEWLTNEVYVYTPSEGGYTTDVKTTDTDTYYKVRAWVHQYQ